MSAGFTFIDQYCNLAKDMEQEKCNDMLNFDQQVPQSGNLSDNVVKQEIICEELDNKHNIFNMVDCVMSDGFKTEEATISHSHPNFFFSGNQKSNFNRGSNSQNKLTTASSTLSYTATTPSQSLISSSVSPLLSSTVHPALVPPSSVTMQPLTYTSTKTSTYVTELAGSGCTVLSNTEDFLLDNSSTMLPFSVQEDGLHYTDLSNQPALSLYDFEPLQSLGKQGTLLDDSSVSLAETVIMVTDTLQNDCDNINVPYDPSIWTSEHVRKWVSWVCQRYHVPDVSNQLNQCDGQVLCSLTSESFSSIFGESGVKISNELELLKAANSCFSSQCTSYADLATSDHLCNPFMESPQNFNLTPCVSPAPSTCSSTHDSSTVSTHSDHSDDESGYGSQNSSFSNSVKFSEANDFTRISVKVPTGRGHKQTIHLWQFLKELLLSKDNSYNDCIRWLDRKTGVFKIEDSKKVASLWGQRKNRPAMNYDKLSRSVRQYYKKGIIKKTEQSKRLIYQFCAGYV